jgi:hypothetical protein
LADEEIKEINASTRRRIKPMTTVIGIKCIDEIVIVSDSQATSETIKDLQSSKVFAINPSIGVGAARNIGHSRVFVEELKRRLAAYTFKTDPLLRGYRRFIGGSHRVYNLERSVRLGNAAPNIIFNADGLLGAKLTDGSQMLKFLLHFL